MNRPVPFILGNISSDEFENTFRGKHSYDFDTVKHLVKVGVINQTTMLASETQEIADYFKSIMIKKFGEADLNNHFADTRDTLCYATNENQEATYGLLEQKADLAIVVGGYNSSNTSHIVELCEKKLHTYFISSSAEIISKDEIRHFDFTKHEHRSATNYLPEINPVNIILTCGASCPDSIVDDVLQKLISYFPSAKNIESVLKQLNKNN